MIKIIIKFYYQLYEQFGDYIIRVVTTPELLWDVVEKIWVIYCIFSELKKQLRK